MTRYYDFKLMEDTQEARNRVYDKDMKLIAFCCVPITFIEQNTPLVIPLNSEETYNGENFKDYLYFAVLKSDNNHCKILSPNSDIAFFDVDYNENSKELEFTFNDKDYIIDIGEIEKLIGITSSEVKKQVSLNVDEPKYRFYIQSFKDEPKDIYDFKIGEVGDFSIYDNGNSMKSDYCLFQGQIFDTKQMGIRPDTNLLITDSSHFNNKKISISLIDLVNAAEKERIKYRKAIKNLPMKLLINDGKPIHAAKFKTIIREAENMLLHSMSDEELKYQIKDLMDKLFDDDKVIEKNDVNILISLIAEYFDLDKDTELKDFSDRLKIMNTLEWRD